MNRHWTIVLSALCAAVVVPTVKTWDAGASAATTVPPYCRPVNRAFNRLATTDPNDFKGYGRAYVAAAKLLRRAAKSAPKDVAEPLKHVSERFREVVEEGETLEVADIHRLGPDVSAINAAVKQQCGFAIATGSEH